MYEDHKYDGSKMTIKVNDKTFSWESPHWDCNMDDYLEAFYGIMVGVTFHPETILNAMKDFAEERLECWQTGEEIEDEIN